MVRITSSYSITPVRLPGGSADKGHFGVRITFLSLILRRHERVGGFLRVSPFIAVSTTEG